MIKALVLDFGNVISEPHDDTVYGRMAERSGLPADFFQTACWKYRDEFDGGKISGKEMYRRVLADGKVSLSETELDRIAGELIIEDIGSWTRINQRVTDWALDLQRQGYVLGILSNMPQDFLDMAGHAVELFSKADVPVFSCHVGTIKPRPEIYRILLDRLGCEGPEVVFFDDLEANVAAARDQGILSYVFAGLEGAKRDWAAAVAGSEPAPAAESLRRA